MTAEPLEAWKRAESVEGWRHVGPERAGSQGAKEPLPEQDAL